MKEEQISKRLDHLTLCISSFGIRLLYGMGLSLAFITAFEGKHYYSAWGYNRAPFEFTTAIYCFTAAWLAFISFGINRYLHKEGKTRASSPRLWFVASAAFVLAGYAQGLSLHERLAPFIERKFPLVRSLVLTNIDSMFLISGGICAVIFTLFFIRELRAVPRALKFYIAGLALVLLAGTIDYLPEGIWGKILPRGLEELSEHFAAISFIVAFFIYAVERAKTALFEWLPTN